MRIALCQINPIIGDLPYNSKLIIKALEKARSAKADIALFPELTLCGYPPEDLLLHEDFITACEKALEALLPHCQGITALIGLPRKTASGSEKPLYNSVAAVENGRFLGFYDKCLLPTYDVFDERRYFQPGKEVRLWNLAGKKVALTICEDIWQHAKKSLWSSYEDPLMKFKGHPPDLVLNLSASPFSMNKASLRQEVCSKVAKSLGCQVLLCNQFGANDSLIFDGHSVAMNSDGTPIAIANGFQEDILIVDTEQKNLQEHTTPLIAQLYQALVLGIRDYFYKQGFTKAVIGLSGGIDSALVACLATEALGSDKVLGVSMPSRYTSQESKSDAVLLANNLGIELQTLPIEEPFCSFLDVLKEPFQAKASDVTEENLQSRIRGVLLMALSNKLGYLVLTTGNKSEMALGYYTLYGDSAGALSVLSDVTKRYVYQLSRWINRAKTIIPQSIIYKAPTAELRLNQKDSDSLPPYEVLDTVVQEYVEEFKTAAEISKKHHFDLNLVEGIIKKIHQNEYKRRQVPLGLRVTEKAFFSGRRFPIVQRWV